MCDTGPSPGRIPSGRLSGSGLSDSRHFSNGSDGLMPSVVPTVGVFVSLPRLSAFTAFLVTLLVTVLLSPDVVRSSWTTVSCVAATGAAGSGVSVTDGPPTPKGPAGWVPSGRNPAKP